jgi:hypothetical protein
MQTNRTLIFSVAIFRVKQMVMWKLSSDYCNTEAGKMAVLGR